MSQKPIVSIVVEMGTREITESIPIENPIQNYLKEARRSFSDSEFEIIFVGCNMPQISGIPDNCHYIDIQSGYYGFKNKGAEIARGRFIVFWDSDCRAEKGYLKRAVEFLENNPSLCGVAGVSWYDGSSYLTRLNTVLNLGHLHYVKDTKRLFVPMAHNVVIRKDKFPSHPFGPHTGRVGGDRHLARYAFRLGYPIKPNSKLQMFHEDHSYSLRAMIEQHFRTIISPLMLRPKASRLVAIRLGAQSLITIQLKRFRNLFKYRKTLNFGVFDTLLALPILCYYTILNITVFIIIALVPSLFNKLVSFQFGKEMA